MKLFIEHDMDPSNPRKEFNTLGTMVCVHRRYNLGDEEHHKWFEQLVDESRSGEDVERALTRDHDAAIILPLYLYDHSGITMSTTPFPCRWDSGQVGFIYLTRAKIKEEFGWTRLTAKRRQQLTRYLEGEVELYDQYLRGDTYGFRIEDDDGEEVDSCWGFYGEDVEGIAHHIAVPKEIVAQAFNNIGTGVHYHESV